MRIATWNVNGIRARQAQFVEWVERDRPDVVCLQEVKASLPQLPPTLCELPGYWCYWHCAGPYSGVGLLLRRETFPEPPRFHHPAFDYETRVVEAEGDGLIIMSVYVPNGGKDYVAKLMFLEAMALHVRERLATGHELLVCGDMNVTRTDQDVHPRERKPNAIGQRPDERMLFERVIAQGLVDLARHFDPENDQLFTWWPPWRQMRERNIGWRLDYILTSPEMARRATSCVVLKDVGTSDHAPVVAVFDLAPD
jgi:exodeoxyribonuclease-3